MNGDDYVIDGNLAFSNTKDALKFYQTEYRKQQEKLTKYELRHAEQRKRIEELEAELKLIDELVTGKAQEK